MRTVGNCMQAEFAALAHKLLAPAAHVLIQSNVKDVAQHVRACLVARGFEDFPQPHAEECCSAQLLAKAPERCRRDSEHDVRDTPERQATWIFCTPYGCCSETEAACEGSGRAVHRLLLLNARPALRDVACN